MRNPSYVRYELQLTRDQYRRLKRAAKHALKHGTVFARDAIMAAVEQVENEMRLLELERASKSRANQRRPVGLGLRESRDPVRIEPVRPIPDPIRPKRPPVAPSAPLDLDSLITYTLAAREPAERARRAESIAHMIAESASSKADAERLTAELDQRLAERQEDVAPDLLPEWPEGAWERAS